MLSGSKFRTGDFVVEFFGPAYAAETVRKPKESLIRVIRSTSLVSSVARPPEAVNDACWFPLVSGDVSVVTVESTIDAATGIDEAAFWRLKRHLDATDDGAN